MYLLGPLMVLAILFNLIVVLGVLTITTFALAALNGVVWGIAFLIALAIGWPGWPWHRSTQ